MTQDWTKIEKETGKAINRLRFKTYIWEDECFDPHRVYRMVNDVRKLAGLEPMPYDVFYEGFQCCRIYAWDYNYALKELKALGWGDF
jgi:hypothetical protein